MSEHRPWVLRMIAWTLVAHGLAWIGILVALAWMGMPLRGPCGWPPPWETEHTVVIVVGVLGLVLPRVLRRTGSAATTLVDGRPLGWIDAARHGLPTLAAAVVLLCSTRALLRDGFHCCGALYRDPIPWWASWHYVMAFGVGVIVALTGTSRSGTIRVGCATC